MHQSDMHQICQRHKLDRSETNTISVRHTSDLLDTHHICQRRIRSVRQTRICQRHAKSDTSTHQLCQTHTTLCQRHQIRQKRTSDLSDIHQICQTHHICETYARPVRHTPDLPELGRKTEETRLPPTTTHPPPPPQKTKTKRRRRRRRKEKEIEKKTERKKRVTLTLVHLTLPLSHLQELQLVFPHRAVTVDTSVVLTRLGRRQLTYHCATNHVTCQ